jgi:hypothetical protein
MTKRARAAVELAILLGLLTAGGIVFFGYQLSAAVSKGLYQ